MSNVYPLRPEGNRVFEDLTAQARSVPLEDLAGHDLTKQGDEYVGPCPKCGDSGHEGNGPVDRFSINTRKQVFNCRRCGEGGQGAIDFIMWLDGCEFKQAVETLTAQEWPRHTAAETPEHRARLQQAAAGHAQKRWRNAKPASAKHPYLRHKQVKPYGLRVEGRELVLPIWTEPGELTSLQLIGPDGSKQFLKDGKVKGGYSWIGNPKGATSLIVAEGYATGASIHEATGQCVYLALMNHNLKAVALKLRQRHPDAKITVAADDDGGVGVKLAIEAAQAVDGFITLPDFGADRRDDEIDFNDMHRAFGTGAVKTEIENAQEANAEQFDHVPGVRFDLTPLDKLSASRGVDYVVKGLVPRQGLVVVWGPPKCGKSFWTFDLMCHAALGWKYRELRVHQTSVVYLALEGQSGFAARRDAFKRKHKIEAIPGFYLMRSSIEIVKDHDQLVKDIDAQTVTPGVIVIDTLNRSMTGSENDPKDMTAYVRAAALLAETFDCAVVIIHHCGVDGSRPRGHTSLDAAAEVQIAIKRTQENYFDTVLEFAKDMPDGLRLSSRLEVVELGTDQDGDKITSCVVDPVGEITSEPVRAPKEKNEAHRMFDAAFDAASGEHGRDHKIGVSGHKVFAVDVALVEDAFRTIYEKGKARRDQSRRQLLEASRVAFQRLRNKPPSGYVIKTSLTGTIVFKPTKPTT
jgi:phage/plasmid primase-like uncharacterized protein